IVNVQLSPGEKSTVGSSVNVVAPPLIPTVFNPLPVHCSWNEVWLTTTDSLNVTDRLAVGGTFAAPLAGMVETTVGARSAAPQLALWLPNPSKVSVARPSHSAEGSNTSDPFTSPAQTLALRRSVLSAVLTRPVPHSVPGSKPICPMTSMIVVPLRRTT